MIKVTYFNYGAIKIADMPAADEAAFVEHAEEQGWAILSIEAHVEVDA